MNPFGVLDCSVALSWCFLDEASSATRQLLERLDDDSVWVPSWWYLELTNALAVAERRGRLRVEQTAEFLTLIECLPILVDEAGPARAFTDLLPLCRRFKLSSYDAVYLDLAQRLQLPLATLDEALRKAAGECGVALLPS